MHEAAFRQSRLSDPYGRYYTSPSISELVVSRLPPRRPRLVLDLGSGDGALAAAAAKRWHRTGVIAIESDPSRSVRSSGFLQLFHADALSTALSQDVGLPLRSFSAAVCNPPFIRPKWRTQFAELLEDTHLSGCYPAVEEAGAAVLFLAQNLRFLRTTGYLALIVPDGILSGIKHRGLREALLSRYQVIEAVELPSGTFRCTEVKTHVLVVRNRAGGHGEVALRRFSDGKLSSPIYPAREHQIDRLDYSYYKRDQCDLRPVDARRTSVTIGDLAEVIERGRVSSSQRTQLGPIAAFHTTDFPSGMVVNASRFAWPAALACSTDGVFARAGDILVARVGRGLHEKVAVLRGRPVALTDCVFRIQVSDVGRRKQLLQFLRSERGRMSLAASTSGTGARHLSKAELSMIIVPGI